MQHFNRLQMKSIIAILTFMVVAFVFAACGTDGEQRKVYNNYSIVWSIENRGAYSPTEANSLTAGFNKECEAIFMNCTETEAKKQFEEFCKYLGNEFDVNYKRITLNAQLVRNMDNVVLDTRTFRILSDNAIGKNGNSGWMRFRLWLKYNLLLPI